MVSEVHAIKLRKRYYASSFSSACFAKLAFILATLLVPFFMAFASQGLWVKEKMYREQPKVEFKKDLILVGRGSSTKDTYMWSTFERMNDAATSIDVFRPAIVKSYEEDWNRDGRVDSIHLNMKLTLRAGETLQGVQLLTFVDYQLQDRAMFQLEGLAYYSFDSSLPGRGCKVDTELRLKQRKPIQDFSQRMEPAHIDETMEYSLPNVTIPALLGVSIPKNESVILVDTFTFWDYGETNQFDLSMEIRIPVEDVQYTPGFGETLKFAWVQYFSIAAVVYLILKAAMDTAFQLQIFTAKVIYDTEPARRNPAKIKPF